ncbi:MAG TPA: ABC transporter permease [Fimbriiglobus sp.]|nr:ABC transporter permease [Fimbriiglobus sp.]
MRSVDLIRSAVSGLWRQKARTTLTLLGVAVGGCALAFSLSLGIGLRGMIDREFHSRPNFWQVHVHVAHQGSAVPEADIPPEAIAVEGAMSDERRQRLRAKKVEQYQNTHPRRPPVPLTPDRIAELAAVPDVTEVVAWQMGAGRAWLGDRAEEVFVVAGKPPAELERRLVAGRMPAPDATDEMLVSEYLLYELGVRDGAQVAATIGRPVRVGVGGFGMTKYLNLARSFGVQPGDVNAVQERALEKIADQLPAAVDKLDLTPAERAALKAMFAERDRKKSEPAPAWLSDAAARAELRVAGVLREPTLDERKELERSQGGWALLRADVFLPPGAGGRLFGQLPWVRETGYEAATLKVRPGGDLKAVAAAAERMGFEQFSAVEWFDAAKREVTLIAAGLNLFALVSLFVAALGITNTLVTSVVERTKEIGVWKALGATDRQVMTQFLAEGAAIGLLGGLLGLGLAWGLSVPGDGLVRRLVQEQSRHEQLISESVFEFPVWLLAATVGFAALVTTLAAVYPARRAARVQPVEALRHE